MPPSSIFLKYLQKMFNIEGLYSNDPSDSGGATMLGITEVVARANGYAGPMDKMSPTIARDIFYNQYWAIQRLDDIASLSEGIAYELFDTGVNCGIGTSGLFLQECLNGLNRLEKDYPDVKTDGLIGPLTVYTLKQFLTFRGQKGELVMLRLLNCLQGARYLDLTQARKKDEKWLFGWVLQRVTLPKGFEI